ncbi:MFS transporter [Streptomyces yaanensis]|uniref:MFS transporter n=1 Tax=Streptomyces yaanensis TaxID=1142239 RepID=A0ABV7SNW6_9ACTN|nr:MFS transporter [Streptomyces sp. CGMCC 4.7035]WNC03186.1 MFS transporter [Streptomyces sp. CGMCC 4.7035]
MDAFGFSPRTFGLFSGTFFLAFAVAQLPLGIAFDRFGIRRPMLVCMTLGTMGAVLLPLSDRPLFALSAQAALGLGCAPAYMGLLAWVMAAGQSMREVKAVTVAGTLGFLGAVIAGSPLAWAVTWIGWRAAMGAAAAAMAVATAGIARSLGRDTRSAPGAVVPTASTGSSRPPSSRRAVLVLLPVCFALAAGGTFRTSWGGPYLSDVFHLGAAARGYAMTAASLGALVTSLLLAAALRVTRIKTLVVAVLSTGVLPALLMALWPARDAVLSAGSICALFCVGSIHPLVMSQARAVVAPHRLGLWLGVLNTAVMLGIALTNAAFGVIAGSATQAGLPIDSLYRRLFLLMATITALGAVFAAFGPGTSRSTADRRRAHARFGRESAATHTEGALG